QPSVSGDLSAVGSRRRHTASPSDTDSAPRGCSCCWGLGGSVRSDCCLLFHISNGGDANLDLLFPNNDSGALVSQVSPGLLHFWRIDPVRSRGSRRPSWGHSPGNVVCSRGPAKMGSVSGLVHAAI